MIGFESRWVTIRLAQPDSTDRIASMPKTSVKTRQSTEDRAAKIAALHDRFEEWSEDQDDVTLAAIVAQWDGYSEHNALLIGMQNPDATDVDGYRAWQGRGRQVRKGEHGIQILAPAGSADEEKNDRGEVTKRGRQFFRIATVFDVSQTDPMEA